MAEEILRRQGRRVYSIQGETGKAKALLWPNWRAVMAVADELMYAVELDGNEAERIVATGRIRKSA